MVEKKQLSNYAHTLKSVKEYFFYGKI